MIRPVDPVSAIYRLIRDLCIHQETTSVAYGQYHTVAHLQQQSKQSLVYSVHRRFGEVLRRVVAQGFTNEQLQQCLKEYEALDILQVAANRSTIKMID
jgi:hypothetical protein